jgi:hypothetical protein
MNRRDWLKMAGFGSVAAFAPLLSGCPQSTGPEKKNDQGSGTGPTPLELAYSETQDFIQKFNDAIKARQEVRVIFDGTNRVSRNSPFCEMLRTDPNLRNRESFVEQIHGLDTDAGRRQLGIIFEQNLLTHQAANSRRRLPSGQTIEPATVCLVIVGLLILVGGVALTTQIVLHGPVVANLEAEAGRNRAQITFRPA